MVLFFHAGVGFVSGVDQRGVNHLLHTGSLGGIHYVLMSVLPFGPHKGHRNQRQAVSAGKGLPQPFGKVEIGHMSFHAHVRVLLQRGLAVTAENQVFHWLQLQQILRRLVA